MMSIYIHIPFCHSICNYCDFCKLYYDKSIIKKYLSALSKEISTTYTGEEVKTIYIGGGTPSSLDMEELSYLFDILKAIDKSNLEEFTIECNIENLTEEKLLLFKEVGINRLSIGVQTFNERLLKILGRNHSKEQVIDLIDKAKKIGFNNINLDLMYGIDGESMDDLKDDVDMYLKLDVSHVSLYSLIIEPHTKLYINRFNEMDEELNAKMYDYINSTLKSNGYHHYEISNYAKEGAESQHNLVYWHNEHYYGFGLGASSYIGNNRYDNTRNLKRYIEGNYITNNNILSSRETMENEMILGLRLTSGVNKETFFIKYNKMIEDVFNVRQLIDKKMLIDKNNFLYIPDDKLFISNSILIEFLD